VNLKKLTIQALPDFIASHLRVAIPPNLDQLSLSDLTEISISDICYVANHFTLKCLQLDESLLGDEEGVKKIDSTVAGPSLVGDMATQEPFWVTALTELGNMYRRDANWTRHTACADLILSRYPTHPKPFINVRDSATIAPEAI